MPLIGDKETLAELLCGLMGRPPVTVLDIGCGRGDYCNWYAKQYGAKCIGIDVAAGAIEAAEASAERAEISTCRFIEEDATQVPVRVRKMRFDLVTFIGSRVIDLAMYNQSDIDSYIGDYWRLVTKGGWLIICENTDYSGRTEPAAGWHLKTKEEIDNLRDAIPSETTLLTVKGLVRARWLYKMPLSRHLMAALIGRLAPKLGLWVTYVVAAQKVAD